VVATKELIGTTNLVPRYQNIPEPWDLLILQEYLSWTI
jgi:hypothetical protein